MGIKAKLEALDLSGSEVRVYLYLTENGVSTPPQVAKATKISLTNIYPLLRALKDRKLVDEQRQGKRKVYLVADPQALLSSIERKRLAIEEVLPELRALHTTQKNRPKIKLYDGWEQVKEIYLQTTKAEEIWSMGSIEYLDKIDHKFYVHLQKEAVKRKQFVYELLPHSAKDIAKELIERVGVFYKPMFLPKRYERLPVEMFIWDNNIALVSLDNPIIGTVITGGYFAQVFKILLEVIRSGDPRVIEHAR